ncbi:MAG: type II toxin-antitoxin system HipA family toxin [Acidiferrobacteraceae bacterium]
MTTLALEVFVSGRRVARLSSDDGFAHHLTYHPEARAADFVSLVMPVRAQSWSWPTLHPFFQVNLPEGFLLSVLKEQLGPHLGSRPLDLLAVVGQNMIGRVQLAPGAILAPAQAAIDLKALLHGKRSAEVFLELMRTHAASGVSGVVPKFLSPETQELFRKGSLRTERHIVKGSSERLPYIALNEHLCMQVAMKSGAATARTEVSNDGLVLVVERFDVAENGSRLGFEDCCSLLGLAPEDKYQSTWERVARLVSDFVAPARLVEANEQLARTLLLTYALGNADCHTKNLAFLYTTFEDVRLAPVYDMLSILAYDAYARNEPGMFVGGRKDWKPGKALGQYLKQSLGIEPARQREITGQVCQAVVDTFPELVARSRDVPGFAPVAARMVNEWNAGLSRLAPYTSVAVPGLNAMARDDGLTPAAAKHRPRRRIGESSLLGRRRPKPAS